MCAAWPPPRVSTSTRPGPSPREQGVLLERPGRVPGRATTPGWPAGCLVKREGSEDFRHSDTNIFTVPRAAPRAPRSSRPRLSARSRLSVPSSAPNRPTRVLTSGRAPAPAPPAPLAPPSLHTAAAPPSSPQRLSAPCQLPSTATVLQPPPPPSAHLPWPGLPWPGLVVRSPRCLPSAGPPDFR